MVKDSLAREHILDAAERLFAEHGFDATATSHVARVAAVPKGLLFYYFPAKADLLRTLVNERLGLGPIDASVLVERGNPVKSLMNLSSKLYEIQAGSEVLRVIIWREQRTHPEVKANLYEHRNQLQAVVERVLRDSLLRPIAPVRLRAAAQAWVAILSALPLADRSDRSGPEDSAAGLLDLAELICDGLIRRRPARAIPG